MKLSKTNRIRQRMIEKTLASGKALGGLLAGLATVITGCRDRSTNIPMGSYPCPPELQSNTGNEIATGNKTTGDVVLPESDETKPKSNAVNEKRRRNSAVRGKYPAEPEE